MSLFCFVFCLFGFLFFCFFLICWGFLSFFVLLVFFFKESEENFRRWHCGNINAPHCYCYLLFRLPMHNIIQYPVCLILGLLLTASSPSLLKPDVPLSLSCISNEHHAPFNIQIHHSGLKLCCISEAFLAGDLFESVTSLVV